MISLVDGEHVKLAEREFMYAATDSDKGNLGLVSLMVQAREANECTSMMLRKNTRVNGSGRLTCGVRSLLPGSALASLASREKRARPTPRLAARESWRQLRRKLRGKGGGGLEMEVVAGDSAATGHALTIGVESRRDRKQRWA
jgi:hypothetical protein